MGEAKRKADLGISMRQVRPGEQIHVDMKHATQKSCECGSKIFIAGFHVFTVSALVSPVGKELTATQPVLICMDCKKVLKAETQEAGDNLQG